MAISAACLASVKKTKENKISLTKKCRILRNQPVCSDQTCVLIVSLNYKKYQIKGMISKDSKTNLVVLRMLAQIL